MGAKFTKYTKVAVNNIGEEIAMSVRSYETGIQRDYHIERDTPGCMRKDSAYYRQFGITF